jgi:hypothetical protein
MGHLAGHVAVPLNIFQEFFSTFNYKSEYFSIFNPNLPGLGQSRPLLFLSYFTGKSIEYNILSTICIPRQSSLGMFCTYLSLS